MHKTFEFIYSEKATKFCEIFPLLLTTVHTVKSNGKISQNFVAFSECMNFTTLAVMRQHCQAKKKSQEDEILGLNAFHFQIKSNLKQKQNHKYAIKNKIGFQS